MILQTQAALPTGAPGGLDPHMVLRPICTGSAGGVVYRRAAEIAAWVEGALSEAGADELRAILAVTPATLRRWSRASTVPTGWRLQRLQVVARVTAWVERSRLPAGVVRWWLAPTAELGGGRPVDLLGSDAGALRRLEPLALAEL